MADYGLGYLPENYYNGSRTFMDSLNNQNMSSSQLVKPVYDPITEQMKEAQFGGAKTEALLRREW